MADGQSHDPGEALLHDLRRLEARAADVRAADRAQLIALIDDIEALRRGLGSECARLDDEFRRTTARITAISAYAGGAQPARLPPRRGH
jgi:hypothetical protein